MAFRKLPDGSIEEYITQDSILHRYTAQEFDAKITSLQESISHFDTRATGEAILARKQALLGALMAARSPEPSKEA